MAVYVIVGLAVMAVVALVVHISSFLRSMNQTPRRQESRSTVRIVGDPDGYVPESSKSWGGR